MRDEKANRKTEIRMIDIDTWYCVFIELAFCNANIEKFKSIFSIALSPTTLDKCEWIFCRFILLTTRVCTHDDVILVRAHKSLQLIA